MMKVNMSKMEFKELLEEYTGKISELDYNWLDNIDHQNPELSICCLAVYVNYNLPGEMWPGRPFFVIYRWFIISIHVSEKNRQH
jgi:hypothetical protein